MSLSRVIARGGGATGENAEQLIAQITSGAFGRFNVPHFLANPPFNIRKV